MPHKSLDVSEQRFHSLVAINRAEDHIGRNNRRRIKWHCKCDCGGTIDVLLSDLRSNHIKHCHNCPNRAINSKYFFRPIKVNVTHGRSKTKEYFAYIGAMARCYNQRCPQYNNYGKRGIEMSPKWRHNFPAFLFDMGECPNGMTLDRIDVNGNYEPGNCRWATRKIQMRNRRNTVMANLLSGPISLRDFSKKYSISYNRLYYYINKRRYSFNQAVMCIRKN